MRASLSQQTPVQFREFRYGSSLPENWSAASLGRDAAWSAGMGNWGDWGLGRRINRTLYHERSFGAAVAGGAVAPGAPAACDPDLRRQGRLIGQGRCGLSVGTAYELLASIPPFCFMLLGPSRNPVRRRVF